MYVCMVCMYVCVHECKDVTVHCSFMQLYNEKIFDLLRDRYAFVLVYVYVCACVCMCVRARACVCVCVCVRARVMALLHLPCFIS